jgi:hypothetical protein
MHLVCLCDMHLGRSDKGWAAYSYLVKLSVRWRQVWYDVQYYRLHAKPSCHTGNSYVCKYIKLPRIGRQDFPTVHPNKIPQHTQLFWPQQSVIHALLSSGSPQFLQPSFGKTNMDQQFSNNYIQTMGTWVSVSSDSNLIPPVWSGSAI